MIFRLVLHCIRSWKASLLVPLLFLMPNFGFAAQKSNQISGFSCPLRNMTIKESSSFLGAQKISIRPANDIYSSVCGWMSKDEFNRYLTEIESDPEQVANLQKTRDRVKDFILPKLRQLSKQQPDFQLGSIHLEDMFYKFDRVRLFSSAQESSVQIDLERRSDFYLPEFRIAVLNPHAVHPDIEASRGILLHILLGASGYLDENYELTMALEMADHLLRDSSSSGSSTLVNSGIDWERLIPMNSVKINHPKHQFTARERQESFSGLDKMYYPLLERIDERIFVADGGTTGAGGGGDSTVAGLKLELLKKMPIQEGLIGKSEPCYKAWSDHSNYIRDMQLLKIEPLNLNEFEPRLVFQELKGWFIGVPKTIDLKQDQIDSLVDKIILYACRSKQSK